MGCFPVLDAEDVPNYPYAHKTAHENPKTSTREAFEQAKIEVRYV